VPRTYDDTGLVRAHARSVRASSQKARTVLVHIRGKSVAEAQAILRYSTRAVARDIELVLRSAVANAVQNHGLEAEQLVVHAATADEGLTMKRGKPRARGRYMRVRRRTCHLTILLLPIELAEVEEAPPVEEAPKPRRSRAKKAEAAAPVEVAEEVPAEEAEPETPAEETEPEATADEPEPEATAEAAAEDAPADDEEGKA
jgi:large subunit ribosomal protein L22